MKQRVLLIGAGVLLPASMSVAAGIGVSPPRATNAIAATVMPRLPAGSAGLALAGLQRMTTSPAELPGLPAAASKEIAIVDETVNGVVGPLTSSKGCGTSCNPFPEWVHYDVFQYPIDLADYVVGVGVGGAAWTSALTLTLAGDTTSAAAQVASCGKNESCLKGSLAGGAGRITSHIEEYLQGGLPFVGPTPLPKEGP